MARLVVITKGLPALSQELGAKWTTIGRGDGNHFQILESSISGRHCEVKLQGEELVVRDLLSTNGTFVGGKKIAEAVVKNGETFRAGEVELRFENSPAPPPAFTSKMLVTRAAAKIPAKPAVSPAREKPAEDISGGKKRHVLFVDDSMAFLETFGGLCLELSNNSWEIYSATTADGGLMILKQHPIELIVVDIGMPGVDGVQLIGIISRHFHGIKIAVMTGKATESNRAACLSNGAELFMEKPVTADGIKIAFNMLNELISWKHREGFSGTVQRVSLPEVIQMECIGRRSSILEVYDHRLRGQIYIETGAVVHAEVETLSGEKAFYKLLSLVGGEFRLKPFQAPPQRTVQDGWETLLMEAARICDEETVLTKRTEISAAK